ncbi:MAG: hypothetical protein ABFD07_16535 [Methanobacterium sp.]
MTQEIKLVQGFQGDLPYTLNFNGMDIDVSSNTTVYFNFTDRRESSRYSILCRNGSRSNEVIIPFTNQTVDHGDFYGEFVIQTVYGKDIYPIEDRIHITIRKCI